MKDLVNNKFLMMSLITKEASNPYDKNLNYDYNEVMVDAADAVRNYLNEKNIDRRVIAVGADPRLHMWDIMSANQNGWKDHIYVATGMYAQMLVEISKPSTALIFQPDGHYNLSATLSENGCELYFPNTDGLVLFERCVRDLGSYPFNYPYKVIDMDDIFVNENELSFDFIAVPIHDLMLDELFLDKLVDMLNDGGIMYILFANESGRLYTDDYYVEPITDIFEKILSKYNLSTYHIPSSIGFQIVVKN
jgi:hypothetical protein